MATPTENWPKPYLLQIHEAAVRDGMVWIKPISEADADSLKSRLYRIRRRSDKSMAAFIPPEYHLVMVGVWEPAEGGRLPILYNRRSDGQPLPPIITASGEEAATYTAPPQLAEPPAPIDLESLDVSIKPDEIDGWVEKLSRDAAKRATKPQDKG